MVDATLPPDHLADFIADHFDSDESIVVLRVLRDHDGAMEVGEAFEEAHRRFGVGTGEDRRVAEKRIELRLRDLAARELVTGDADGRYRFRPQDGETETLLTEIMRMLDERRKELTRLVYSTSARARRLAEAFRL